MWKYLPKFMVGTGPASKVSQSSALCRNQVITRMLEAYALIGQ